MHIHGNPLISINILDISGYQGNLWNSTEICGCLWICRYPRDRPKQTLLILFKNMASLRRSKNTFSSPTDSRTEITGWKSVHPAQNCVAHLFVLINNRKIIEISVDFHGFRWISMDSYGFPWIPMDSDRFPLISVDFYGFLWISIYFLLIFIDFAVFLRRIRGLFRTLSYWYRR